MAIVINGSGTVTGISVGGLPDAIVDASTLATNSVDSAELVDGAVDDSHMAAMAASKLTGALPAIDGSNLTGMADLTTIENNIALLGFYRASDNSKAKYSLVDQVIDEYTDATGIDAGNSTNENLSSGVYSGGTTSDPTGGTVTTYSSGGNDYRVHTFSADGSLVIGSSGSVDMLIVGGGGSGGGDISGGGGAGGVRAFSSVSVTAQTYAITVGEGAPHVASGGNASNGEDTVAIGYTATGGGAGGRHTSNAVASGQSLDGGSGGGAGGRSSNIGGSGNTPSTSPSQGNDGGGPGWPHNAAGGGGGAGAVGTGASGNNGGAGGVGVQNNFRTGSNIYYGGGGGGGSDSGGSAGAGGNGGGGLGSVYGNTHGTAGTDGLGGGGGGSGGAGRNGAAGGDGVVVSRYVDGSIVSTTAQDLTLQSVATTAESAPTTGDIVILIEDSAGTATINTDVKAYISRDGSAFTSAVTLTDEGNWGTNKRILAAHDVDISGITSGTSMKYKITTHNQSAGSKETKIHATSLAWA